MTDKKYYVFDDWFKEGELSRRGPDYRQLLQTYGRGTLLFYKEEDDWQGDWVAVLADSQSIAVVDGRFGSCGGCDALLGAEDSKAYGILAKEYLRSVRTFDSWDMLLDYFKYLQESSYDERLLKIGREEIIFLARVDMPLEARDIFERLHLDDPKVPIHEIAERAKALN